MKKFFLGSVLVAGLAALVSFAGNGSPVNRDGINSDSFVNDTTPKKKMHHKGDSTWPKKDSTHTKKGPHKG